MAINPIQPGLQSQSLASDTKGVDALRYSASKDPKAAIKETAKQFEGLFMQQLMKSMRQATLSSGMLENSGTQMGTELLDTQLAQSLSGRPGGLSEMIAKHLERQLGEPLANMAKDSASAQTVAATGQTGTAPLPASLQGKERQVGFLKLHDSAAKAAEAETGIPATFMVAQAAHESGWGRHEIRNTDGSSSFNLFGIKAGKDWTGPTTTVTTTEVVNGQPHKVQAKFRAYASYEESFKDYAKLMKDNPRYSKVVAAGNSAQGFAHGLQRAGYATDPEYAKKLTNMINTTLRLQRATA
ncbi:MULTISPECIES: flagellar assembly peptidoglycan hydrolase FlgJ [unclassified Rhizobacter]|uniref:flagellar assembly peptidoglycan hydrolase FlgJ n=1 Tax=unclassified Rhizobacter TaxID=2640088 RepID=UPI0006F2EF83|nr:MULTISPECIES: flagellar assembly peptidoglycan hydrolase FlgJ [unclassified Rhizobacter]KQU71321.1 glucosaminidase [Rhizobacter sp. Root29]KQW10633.1 glucosaminidase [Rhizobacter sp. Root1238]KRB24709.1 glucosaminidase [Rhizobacter sp. Root16D2]